MLKTLKYRFQPLSEFQIYEVYLPFADPFPPFTSALLGSVYGSMFSLLCIVIAPGDPLPLKQKNALLLILY